MQVDLDTSHYDCFTIQLSEEEISSGRIRLDPYRVADVWKLGQRDNSGCLFHILKTIARQKEGNSSVREVQSIKASILRKEELLSRMV